MTSIDALFAAARHPEAVLVRRCARCQVLRLPGRDPHLALCRRCLREVLTLFDDAADEPTIPVDRPYFLIAATPNQEGRNPAPISGA